MNRTFQFLSASFSLLWPSGNNQTSTSPARATLQNEGDEPSISYADICVTRAMLKALGLPTELVLEILAHAQYEPVIEFTSRRRVVAEALMGAATSANVCLPAEVLSRNTIRRVSGPNVTLKVKEIKFDIKSKDQGWTSENTTGTFNTSSWLEVSIFRPGPQFSSLEDLPFWTREYDNPQELQEQLSSAGHKLVDERPENASVGAQGGEPPLAWYLQGNKVAERQHSDYQIVWAPDRSEGNQGAGKGDGFFGVLQEGDSVLVWARAKYPGWRCQVDNVKMTVRYSFDEPS
ncbi:hypothetical protein DPSP01_012947 [Paraphaeosphaeria sporulosa]|uniref:Uncharacterized protein n=1 Tax=Paraphaeosphaeria sporulosa TaxID=1460663 RepID=A0A177BVW2_9PLEO|nr:uncharacterized protein CC84DRAFT_1156600 [Paraphaeosphaeria sporulosa]OAF99633.1 hypothetical protein CC84DRAFT_1156600 [Paraphaeosphaeria sporulosa]